MEDLRVPKRRIHVEIVQPGGAVRRVVVFLAEAAVSHGGPERLSDVLNGREEFVPAHDEEAGVMTFLNRRSVALARVARDAEEEPCEEVTIPAEHEVEITLLDGSRLRGLVSYVRPGNARLVDYLNETLPFFRLLEQDTTALVSRHHVARVALLRG
jgi:hypothetical protein